MAQITDYDTLVAALADWSEWDDFYDADEVIGLAEADFRLFLGPHFAKEASATLAFTSGSATLPTGFVRPISLIHATYGELTQSSIGNVRQRRVWDASGIPDIYAIRSATVEVAPSYTGNLTFDYEGSLTGLSGSNATNWLITNGPQAYLSMCMSVIKARQEDFQTAALLKSNALATVTELSNQAVVGQLGAAAVRIHGSTP